MVGEIVGIIINVAIVIIVLLVLIFFVYGSVLVYSSNTVSQTLKNYLTAFYVLLIVSIICTAFVAVAPYLGILIALIMIANFFLLLFIWKESAEYGYAEYFMGLPILWIIAIVLTIILSAIAVTYGVEYGAKLLGNYLDSNQGAFTDLTQGKFDINFLNRNNEL